MSAQVQLDPLIEAGLDAGVAKVLDALGSVVPDLARPFYDAVRAEGEGKAKAALRAWIADVLHPVTEIVATGEAPIAKIEE